MKQRKNIPGSYAEVNPNHLLKHLFCKHVRPIMALYMGNMTGYIFLCCNLKEVY